jgi:DNA-binding response OmpR family regulator
MQLSKRRILYIEDHADTRDLVKLVLQQKDFEVITGSTVADGVKFAESGRFSLYLLDSWLPDGSGLDLCRMIRIFDKTTPILFYSAAAYEADRELALESGAQGYLVKPTQTTELCSLVSSLIEKFDSDFCASSSGSCHSHRPELSEE